MKKTHTHTDLQEAALMGVAHDANCLHSHDPQAPATYVKARGDKQVLPRELFDRRCQNTLKKETTPPTLTLINESLV